MRKIDLYYASLTSRFLSPDPYIQAPGQWLNYDRYAYAMNNPMLYTDPSGYFFKDAWNWFWDKADQFATWAQETPWFPSSGGAGINSAGETWHFVGTSGPIYHNQLGNDYAGVVDAAISDARGREAFVSGESLKGVTQNIGSNDDAQTLFLLGLGLTADGAKGAASVFQESNAAVRGAAVRNHLPTAQIDKIMGNTSKFATGAKWAGRGVIVVGAGISIYQGYNAYAQGDIVGATKSGLDLGVGLGAAAIGGVPGVVLYGGYLFIMQPPPGGPEFQRPNIFLNDNTYVEPPVDLGL